MAIGRLTSASVVVLSLSLAAAGVRAQDGEADENDYDEEGVVEIGGSIGTSWNENLFTVDLSPQIGWFLATGFELSLIVRGEYVNEEEDDGTRTSTKAGSAVIEPSYHFPIQDESVFAFGGLGVGGGYDGEHPDFELVPRVGLNVELGRAAVLTPAVRVPVLFGQNQGPANDEAGVLVGFAFEIGVTSVL